MRAMCLSGLLLSLSSCTEPDPKLPSDAPSKQQEAPQQLGSSADSADTIFTLRERPIFNGALRIAMPPDFAPLNAAELERKYPDEQQRPSIVYANRTGAVNVAFTYTKRAMAPEGLERLQKDLAAHFAATSGIELKESALRTINGQTFVTLEFYSSGVDLDAYNLMFATSVADRLLICSFNCTVDILIPWKERGARMVESVRIPKR